MASAKAAPYRAEALRRGEQTPGGWPRFTEYVAARRYAVTGTAPSRSVRVTRPTVPTIVLPRKITVKGARFARVNSLRSPLTVIFPGKTIGTCQVGRGSGAAPARAKRTVVARATRLDLTFQLPRTRPSACQGERNALIEGAARRYAAASLLMILQALIKVLSETDVVLHRPVIRTLVMEQVNGALNRHKDMLTLAVGRNQVREFSVRSDLTMICLSWPRRANYRARCVPARGVIGGV